MYTNIRLYMSVKDCIRVICSLTLDINVDRNPVNGGHQRYLSIMDDTCGPLTQLVGGGLAPRLALSHL